jgi:hypothetical protein
MYNDHILYLVNWWYRFCIHVVFKILKGLSNKNILHMNFQNADFCLIYLTFNYIGIFWREHA